MKILIFEYLCGGGGFDAKLPNTVAKEGLLMLQALLNDLALIQQHHFLVLLDAHFINDLDTNVKIIPIQKQTPILTSFKSALVTVDAVWLIAPETKQILFHLTQLVESSKKILLSSPSPTIAKAADKWQTFQCLSAYYIPTVSTAILNKNSCILSEKTVIKIREGVGCEQSFIVHSQQELALLLTQLDKLENYIIQPFIEGENLSLSVLFKHGKAQLLCVNRQKIQIVKQQFKLLACEVNCKLDHKIFQQLSTQIAIAFPNLWGYVGIDLIQHSQQLYVLEINPRLTSSYVGISQALGINVAAVILKLLDARLKKIPLSKHSVTVHLT